MPNYNHRPDVSGDTEVWRYLSLHAVIATIETRRLRMTRIDRFRDPFEGSVPKSQIDNQVPLFSGTAFMRNTRMTRRLQYPEMTMPEEFDEDDWTRMTRLRRAKTRSAHASCWSMGHESEPIWRLYCTEDGTPGVGVALRTTLARLEASVAIHDLYVSPIIYRLYHEGPQFTDELDAFFHKRQGFAAERELRLLRFDQAQFHALIPRGARQPELGDHLEVDWVPSDVVEEIVISPYADVDYENEARQSVNAADSNLADRIRLSVLHERRHRPQF